MIPFYKKIRYSWWLITTFIYKNLFFVTISFIFSFLFIFFVISIFPTIKLLFFHPKITIGIVGNYTLQNIPFEIQNLITKPLLSVNPDGEIKPVLAEAWEASKDNKKFRIFLKKNLYWDDKKIFNAHDVIFNAQGVQTKIINEHTIDFILDHPLPIFLVYLDKPIIRKPLHGVEGNYKVQRFTLSSQNFIKNLVLIPKNNADPLILYKFYETEEMLIAAYKLGEINKFSTNKKEIEKIFSNWKNTVIYKSVDYSKVMTIFFNTKNNFLSDREIRKALVYATKRFSEEGQTATGPISPESWAYTPNTKQYPFSIQRASEIIKSDNKSTQSAKLTFVTFFEYSNLADSLLSGYKKAGFSIELKLLSYIPDSFDIFLTLWNLPKDPDQYFFWHSTQKSTNITRYSNAKIDKLLEDGRSSLNIQQRKKYYFEFQQFMAEDLPAFFLYYPFVYTIERK